jgi:hypothetical protein
MGELIPIVAIVMGMLTVLIPITGFTARFALKPIAEAVATARGPARAASCAPRAAAVEHGG